MLFACSGAANTVTVRGANVSAGAREPEPRPSAAASLAPAPPPIDGPASACFAEPVVYDKTVAANGSPSETEAPARQCDTTVDVGACRFEVARAYLDASHFERAGPLLLALAHAKTTSNRPLAAELALDALDALARHAEPPRTACYDVMADETTSLLTELCTPDPQPGAEKVCAILHRIELDMRRNMSSSRQVE